MYRKHVVVEHVPQAHRSPVQPISSSQSSTPSKYYTCRPECDNASQQTKLARASMSSRISTADCALKTNEDMDICPTYKNMCFSTRRRALGICKSSVFIYKRGHSLAFTSFLVSERSG